MTITQTVYANRIALHVGKQCMCSADVGSLSSRVRKKAATEFKFNLRRGEYIVNIA